MKTKKKSEETRPEDRLYILWNSDEGYWEEGDRGPMEVSELGDVIADLGVSSNYSADNYIVYEVKKSDAHLVSTGGFELVLGKR